MASVEPTKSYVRYRVIFACMLMAILLYLDRFCISFAEVFIKDELGLTDHQIGILLGSFFVSYALCQVPSGWFSDRFGARKMLTLYILMWSLFTALTGFATGFVMLLIFRLGFGLSQAGAYPTSANVVSKWMPLTERGFASSMVTVGGRIGGALAPVLTAFLIILFVPMSESSDLKSGDIMNPHNLAETFLERVDEKQEFETKIFEGLTSESRNYLNAEAVAAKAEAAAVAATTAKKVAKDTAAIAANASGENKALAETEAKNAADAAELAVAEAAAAADAEVEAKALVKSFTKAESSFLVNLNTILQKEMLYDPADFEGLTLNQQAEQLLNVNPGEMNLEQTSRLNRLLFEARYYSDVRKVQGKGWRKMMMTYGVVGILIAGIFWWIIRDYPRAHSSCSKEELELIEKGRLDEDKDHSKQIGGIPFKAITKNKSLWLLSLSQFCTNVGWLFLVTWLPRFLDEAYQVPLEERGKMITFALAIGWLGTLSGGKVTDWLMKRISLRWSRVLPIAISRFTAMAAYLVCMLEISPWFAVVMFSIVAFSTDFGSPAMWAFNQDIAGKHVGSVLGWGNMWGNLGAAVAPSLMIAVIGEEHHWNMAFVTCAVAFLIAGVASLWVDPSQTLVVETDEEEGSSEDEAEEI
ncbi:putative sulfoacetate transporter SauU [Gimesia alba]|uniref:Putative sulfoacetate transporter SauU n=1 Tax=Gimesia alba TaxID=2527973 RepID=A0A517RG51_9PLAN|nr:MFS transporter [Gimesia alba]QDT42847.1 putative sulfoacetate transporter SauU [Gimesia alba]